MEENRLLRAYKKWEYSLMFSEKDETLELEEFRNILRSRNENEIIAAIMEMPKRVIGDRFLKEIAKISPHTRQVSERLKKEMKDNPTMKKFLLRCISVIDSNLTN